MAALVAALLMTGCGGDDDESQPKPQGLHFEQEQYQVLLNKVVQLRMRFALNGSESEYDFTTNPYGVGLTSADPAVAQVFANGTVTGTGYGTTTITAKSTYFSPAATTTISVMPSALYLDKTNYVLSPGGTVRARLMVKENGVESESENLFGIVWKTADESVAAVAADGTLTGAGYGTTTLTGTSPLLDQPLTATVAVQLQKLRFEAAQYTTEIGGTAKPRLLVTENGVETEADNDRFKLTWSIGDTSVASLAADGTVTGLQGGVTTLTVTTPYYPQPVTTQISVRGTWSGEWMLTQMDGNDAMSGRVYIALNPDGTFALYQSLDVAGFAAYQGTYQVSIKNDKNVLSGVYSDGKAWAAEYYLSRDGDTLSLTSLVDGVVCLYALTEIPDYVKDGVTGIPAAGTPRIGVGKRFL